VECYLLALPGGQSQPYLPHAASTPGKYFQDQKAESLVFVALIRVPCSNQLPAHALIQLAARRLMMIRVRFQWEVPTTACLTLRGTNNSSSTCSTSA
jgi:hypothetical protein